MFRPPVPSRPSTPSAPYTPGPHPAPFARAPEASGDAGAGTPPPHARPERADAPQPPWTPGSPRPDRPRPEPAHAQPWPPDDAERRAGRYTDDATPAGERTYATLTHLSVFAIAFIGIPVVIPLVMWLVRRSASPFLDDHGREAVNFQISLAIYALVGLPLFFLCGAGAVLWAATVVLAIVGSVLAAMAANRGEYFRYPATLRLVA